MNTIQEEKQISAYVDWYTRKFDLEPPSAYAARLGLQMLEVAICRILDGNPINDFMEGPAQHLAPVCELYQAYVDGTMSLDAIVTQLRTFNERYVDTVVLLGLPEEFIRATGVQEIRGEQGHPNP